MRTFESTNECCQVYTVVTSMSWTGQDQNRRGRIPQESAINRLDSNGFKKIKRHFDHVSAHAAISLQCIGICSERQHFRTHDVSIQVLFCFVNFCQIV
jgi:hypothetical protein